MLATLLLVDLLGLVCIGLLFRGVSGVNPIGFGWHRFSIDLLLTGEGAISRCSFQKVSRTYAYNERP